MDLAAEAGIRAAYEVYPLEDANDALAADRRPTTSAARPSSR